MSGASKIEWTDKTWEVVKGCSPVSPSCANCYAERLTWRLAHNRACGERYRGLVEMRDGRPRWTGEVRCDESVLSQPLYWRKPARVFVCSRSDLFHPKVPFSFIAEVFNVMFGEASASPQPKHIYLVLTKRSVRMREFFDWCSRGGDGTELAMMLQSTLEAHGYFPRVWLGVTVENQEATKRLDDLVATPAAVRFVSLEPLLEPIDFDWCEECNRHGLGRHGSGEPDGGGGERECGPSQMFPPIDWVISGSESGPHARPAQLDWFRSARDQCVAAGVPYFFKQWIVNGKKTSTPELDGQRWVQYPEAKR